MLALLHLIPKNHLSQFIGWAARIQQPQAIVQKVIQWFVRRYQVDVTEIGAPLASYRSVAAFFIRDLKPGVRPITEGLVSPVDGTLRTVESITSDSLTQVKGRHYSLAALLGAHERAQTMYGGQLYNLYLSPKDYHHVHAPIDWKITTVTHIPGALWPVNDWSLGSIDNLFGVNERVVIEGQSIRGPITLVMVGATNVGRIRLTFDERVRGNAESHRKLVQRYEYPGSISVKAGDKIGTFELGSSVVMVLDKAVVRELARSNTNYFPRPVRYGEQLESFK